jgi:hypothetical protein
MSIYNELIKDKLDIIFETKGEKYVISNNIKVDSDIDGVYKIVWDKYYRYDNFIPTVIKLTRLGNLKDFKIVNGKYFINSSTYYSSEIIEIDKEKIRNKKINLIQL